MCFDGFDAFWLQKSRKRPVWWFVFGTHRLDSPAMWISAQRWFHFMSFPSLLTVSVPMSNLLFLLTFVEGRNSWLQSHWLPPCCSGGWGDMTHQWEVRWWARTGVMMSTERKGLVTYLDQCGVCVCGGVQYHSRHFWNGQCFRWSEGCSIVT